MLPLGFITSFYPHPCGSRTTARFEIPSLFDFGPGGVQARTIHVFGASHLREGGETRPEGYVREPGVSPVRWRIMHAF